MTFERSRILVLGSSGQVGRSMRRLFKDSNNVFFADRTPQDQYTASCDLLDEISILNLLDSIQPQIIINCAAYTAVDLAEKETGLAMKINSDAVVVIAKKAHNLNAVLIHYSTDYVFDGSGDKPWQEDDKTGPINAYGRSKLGGETAVLEHCPQRGYVFRTQWVYDNEGKNFLNTMLRLAAEKEHFTVVNDQIGAPTPSHVIATYTLKALQKITTGAMPPGIYHLTCRGQVSWNGFAEKIFEVAKQRGIPLKVRAIQKIESKDFPTPAVRPKNSRLSLEKFESYLGEQLPSWEVSLGKVLDERLVN